MPTARRKATEAARLAEAPSASSDAARRRMEAQRRRDTAPELALRRALHRRGFRFRVDHPVPGGPRRRADLVFPACRLAVFVDGCFWHGCELHARPSKVNTEWWTEKIARNKRRDEQTRARLIEHGWTVVRVWEHEDMEESAERVAVALAEARAALSGES